jgi:YfiR/HmsC-like
MASIIDRQRRARQWFASILCSISFLVFGHPRSLAQSPAPDEYQVRAAIILNITRFVTWPDTRQSGPRTPFVVCLLGYDQGSATLEKFMAGRSIDGRVVVARRIASTDAMDGCSLVYVTSAERIDFQKHFGRCTALGVLTVSDDSRFVHSGGVVGLPVAGDHVEIQINLLRAQRSRLTISSRLLHLATVVRDGEE